MKKQYGFLLLEQIIGIMLGLILINISIEILNKQFNNQNDYINYPKVIDKDIKLLEDRDVAIIFTPLQEMLYPRNYNLGIGIRFCI